MRGEKKPSASLSSTIISVVPVPALMPVVSVPIMTAVSSTVIIYGYETAPEMLKTPEHNPKHNDFFHFSIPLP